MPIVKAVINAADITRSVAFYTELFDLRLIDECSERAVLDAVGTLLDLRVGPTVAEPSTFVPDNLQRGFRHIGFKVTDIDARAEKLRAAGVTFLFEPLNVGSVRVCFFYDPDGTLLEFVEGDLQYTQVLDDQAVADERGLGTPSRPRLDHIAMTVDNREETSSFYETHFGFTRLGIIDPPIDMDGFSIAYLKSGPTVLELFTFTRETRTRTPQIGSPGFAFAELIGPAHDDLTVAGTSGAETVYSDASGFTFSRGQA